MSWHYGEGVQNLYDEQTAQAIRGYRETASQITPQELKAGAMVDRDIRADISRQGGSGDIPPSVARMYREYREQQEAAQVKADNLIAAREDALRVRQQVQAGGLRQMERKGYSAHNELTRRCING